jgi:prolyl oligopeptidase
MKLIAEAFYDLFRTEWRMWRSGFTGIHDLLRKTSARPAGSNSVTPEQACEAVDMACVLYFKNVLCLQRSAATALVLRRHGFAARLVIGAGILPFKSHAWVELDGMVVNDKSYIPELYRELDRC